MQQNPRNNGKTLALLHGQDLDDRSASPELAPIEGNGDTASTNGHAEGNLSAVIYLRVSTKEQAEKGGEKEGFSIPAQREACTTQGGISRRLRRRGVRRSRRERQERHDGPSCRGCSPTSRRTRSPT